ncbi:MAG: NAD(P)H-hydrate dehydratase, partial [Rhabdochlamydiaceae bacterium]
HGRPDEPMTRVITWANSQDVPVLAIDIPSGLDGSTGAVETVAINATITCGLGLPKIGCFIGKGWDYVGTLLTCDINIPPEIVSHATSTALLLKKESLQLPLMIRSRHKYEAGYVLGISGSIEMPGAAALSTLATLRSGAGIVRLFTQADTLSAHLAPEVIREAIDLKRIEEEQPRADALFIGPGLGRTSEIHKFMRKLLPRLTKPTVVDGDALYHLAIIPDFSLPTDSILTPHHGEMTRLLRGPPTLESCQRWVEKHEVMVILKGAPTILFYPKRHPLMITAGDPGMATAGSGDVLTGIVAALLAQKMPPYQAAPLAVYLHGRAGEIAAEKYTSYGMIASDLIECLPKAFTEL